MAQKPNNAARARSFTDPAEFQRVWLNRHLTEVQKQILHSVATNPLTAVKGCHASGKTFDAAGLPLWWITRHQQSKALNTAPTLRQVKGFWNEIAIARKHSNLISILPEPTTTGLKISDERFAFGASSSRGVNMQGLHSPNVLIIIDEAPGVPPDIWDAIEGIRSGGNVHVLALGNPVVPAGEFFDAFHRGRKIWNCISISAFDTPNLQHEVTKEPLTIEDLMTMTPDRLAIGSDPKSPFHALIQRAWVKERYLAWGPTHPKYLSRVLAQFPTQADNAVFSLAWIEGAKREPNETDLKHAAAQTIQVGIDVAGAGSDETVLVARVGGIILELHAWADPDPRGPVLRVLGRLKHHPLYRLGMVVVDTIGIGYNFALHIVDNGFDVFGFIAGAKPVDSTMFRDQKAEATWTAREAFRTGYVCGLGTQSNENGPEVPEEETEAQLSTMLYRETSRGLTEIIPKDEMLKLHGIGSPDRAEALIMAFAHIQVAHRQEVYDEPYQISPV